MSKLIWDAEGKRQYESGVNKAVLYPYNTSTKAYKNGVAWNGITGFNESPSGAEPNDLYADNIKYATFRAAEKYNATIEAYTYPDEFAECDGSKPIAKGVYAGQQSRSKFGFSCQTGIGDDTTDGPSGYKLHIVYGCTASPSSKDYATINDSPDAITFSWEIESDPVELATFKPISSITIDSREVVAEKLKAIEDALYGTDSVEAKLLTPQEIKTIMET